MATLENFPLLEVGDGQKKYYIEFSPVPRSLSPTRAPVSTSNTGSTTNIRPTDAPTPPQSKFAAPAHNTPNARPPRPFLVPRISNLQQPLPKEVCNVIEGYRRRFAPVEKKKEDVNVEEKGQGAEPRRIRCSVRRYDTSDASGILRRSLILAVKVPGVKGRTPRFGGSPLSHAANRPASPIPTATATALPIPITTLSPTQNLITPSSSTRALNRMATVALVGDRAEVISWLEERWKIPRANEDLVYRWTKRAMVLHVFGWDGKLVKSFENDPRQVYHRYSTQRHLT